MLDSVYENEIPVIYDPPKSEKIHITDNDLYQSDLFSFGSIIGSITNKSTSAYALLPLLKRDSKEYNTTMNRIRMCTKLQSAQIDKAKIGREVKGIPKIWLQYQKINKDDSLDLVERKNFLNSILLDKHPYFFRYLYKDTNNRYRKHYNGYDLTCRQKFNMPLDDLINKKRKNKKQREFLEKYYEFMPVIDSDSPMNLLCKYIESVDFDIKNKIKDCGNMYKKFLLDIEVKKEDYDKKYKQVKDLVSDFIKEINDLNKFRIGTLSSNKNKVSDESLNEIEVIIKNFKESVYNAFGDDVVVTNILIEVFNKHNYNLDLLWKCFGDKMYENLLIKLNKNSVLLPMPNSDGDIEYLGNKYKLEEVII